MEDYLITTWTELGTAQPQLVRTNYWDRIITRNKSSFRETMNVNFGMNPYSTPTRRNMKDEENIFEIEDYMNFQCTYIPTITSKLWNNSLIMPDPPIPVRFKWENITFLSRIYKDFITKNIHLLTQSPR